MAGPLRMWFDSTLARDHEALCDHESRTISLWPCVRGVGGKPPPLGLPQIAKVFCKVPSPHATNGALSQYKR